MPVNEITILRFTYYTNYSVLYYYNTMCEKNKKYGQCFFLILKNEAMFCKQDY